ncbi:hypothetical protein [Deinococcus wulumuqiensis]|uniref:hypothetical protein n=1 Tax=Deinococcus wulumuqiensis TaxID=980427 RepID=UPI0024328BEC|nr:hypothetical protein [Deinococcus wulumuqiensis]
MLLLWERGLFFLLLLQLGLLQLGRLVWLNVALSAYLPRTPLSGLAEGLLLLGLVLAARSPDRRIWLSLTLGWARWAGRPLWGACWAGLWPTNRGAGARPYRTSCSAAWPCCR